jgi:two-component system, sensor histidine kinase PdtaS
MRVLVDYVKLHIQNKIRIAIILVLFYPMVINGQRSIDSLKNELRGIHQDSKEYTNTLIKLAVEFRQTNPDSSLYYGQKAVEACVTYNYSQLLTPALNSVSTAYSFKGMYDSALVVRFKAIAHGETQPNKLPLIKAYNGLAIDYYYRKDLDEAKKYFELSYKLAVKEGHALEEANALQNIGLVKGVQGFVDEEIANYKKARAVFVEMGFEEGVANIDMNLGTAYVPLNKYDSGLYFFENAKKIFTSLNQQAALCVVHTNLAETYLMMGELDKAEKNALTSIEISKELELKNEEKYITEVLGRIYRDQGNFENAYETQTRYQLLKDTIFNQEKLAQIEKLRVEFETEQKENEITLLNTSNELKDGRIRQQNFLIIATVIGAFLILLLAGVLYNRYMLKNKLSTELTLKNSIISSALEEKETLLKEIHHRVKNNLQIIESLLNLQNEWKGDRSPEELLRLSQDRIHAISAIHDKLYQSSNFKAIDFKTYTEDLITYFKDSYGTKDWSIQSKIEEVDLDLDQLIPCGLILNELITNSIKYAFKENQKGIINVLGHCPEQGKYCLEVKDSGVGLDSDFDLTQSNSLGLKLVKSLSNQLDGIFEIMNGPGANFKITFTT